MSVNDPAITDVMVDIETLGLKADAVVLSIAAVQFKLYDEGPLTFGRCTWVLDLNTQFGKCRSVNQGTLDFWSKQDAEARAHWALGKPMPVELALRGMAALVPENALVWANGIVFDIGILESLHEDFGEPLPWRYNAPRDCRTIYRTLKEERSRPPKYVLGDGLGPAHNPESDCMHQIWSLWEHWPSADLDRKPKPVMEPAPVPRVRALAESTYDADAVAKMNALACGMPTGE
jgi:hypothetical protein